MSYEDFSRFLGHSSTNMSKSITVSSREFQVKMACLFTPA